MGSVVWAARVPDHWSRSTAVISSGLLTEPFCPTLRAASAGLTQSLTEFALLSASKLICLSGDGSYLMPPLRGLAD